MIKIDVIFNPAKERTSNRMEKKFHSNLHTAEVTGGVFPCRFCELSSASPSFTPSLLDRYIFFYINRTKKNLKRKTTTTAIQDRTQIQTYFIEFIFFFFFFLSRIVRSYNINIYIVFEVKHSLPLTWSTFDISFMCLIHSEIIIISSLYNDIIKTY